MAGNKSEKPQKTRWRRKVKRVKNDRAEHFEQVSAVVRSNRSQIDYKKRAKRNRIKRRIALGIFLLSIILCVMFFAPFFSVSKIITVPAVHINEQDIIFASGINNGNNIFNVMLDCENVARRIQRIPYAAESKISFSLPSTVKIEVIEEIPFAYVALSDESIAIINIHGRVLECGIGINTEGLMQIIAAMDGDISPGGKIFEESSENSKKYLATVAEIAHNNIMDRVSYIDISDEGRLRFKFDQLIVELGDINRLDYKLNNLKAVIEKLGSNPKGRLDLSVPGKSYYDNSVVEAE